MARKETAAVPTCTFDEAVRDIASAVKTLTDAGMGASCAGELAFKVWCAHNGVCPPEPSPAE